MIRLLIVDDHAIVRKGMIQIISEAEEKIRVDEADCSEAALERLDHNAYDIVILDISLPGANGIELLEQIVKRKPGLPVLMLSMHPEEQYAVRTFKSGAYGYLTKKSAGRELLTAIHRILSGKRYVSLDLAEKLAFDLGTSINKPLHDCLSEREFQVMIKLAGGLTPKTIADELGLSNKTVSTYRARILEKMRFHSNADIVHYAIKSGLIQ